MKRICVLLSVLLASCGDDKPVDYIKIAGGGLTFNYRYSQLTIVIVVKTLAPPPAGGHIEALFQHPGKQKRELVTRPVVPGKLTYKLESGYLSGVKIGEPLAVTLRVVDATGKVLEIEERSYASDVDQSTLPSKPLMKPDVPNYVPQLENL